MRSKTVSFVLISCLLASVQGVQQSTVKPSNRQTSELQIYLPREITINGNAIILGQVGIIRGNPADGGLAAKASEIALGRFSVPGQKIIIDKTMVLSRLACNGIPASKVTLTGAEKVTVKQHERTISGKEFVELTSSFLKKNPPVPSVCQLTPIRIPTDFVVPGVGKDIKLSPHLARSTAGNRAKVQISVLSDGKEIGMREVSFRLKHNCRRAVTLVDIPAGAVISHENIKIEKTVSNYPEPSDWRPPYGFVARRLLPANTVIHPNMVGPVKPAVIIKRNQAVVIRVERPGFLITAIGRAMQKGSTGDYIKVQNVDSQRIIIVRVNEDGTVEPVF
jgi:flagella basal body P-ring formation protein FlgA